MLKILLLVAVTVQLSAAQTLSVPISGTGTLVSAEKLSDAEMVALKKATSELAKAQAQYQKSIAEIAAAHKMEDRSSWSFSEWYTIDGDWILQRSESRLSNVTFTNY